MALAAAGLRVAGWRGAAGLRAVVPLQLAGPLVVAPPPELAAPPVVALPSELLALLVVAPPLELVAPLVVALALELAAPLVVADQPNHSAEAAEEQSARQPRAAKCAWVLPAMARPMTS